MRINIEGVRGQIGDSKEEFAKKLNMATNTYSKKLKGETEWKPSQLMKICQLGNITLEELDYQPVHK